MPLPYDIPLQHLESGLDVRRKRLSTAARGQLSRRAGQRLAVPSTARAAQPLTSRIRIWTTTEAKRNRRKLSPKREANRLSNLDVYLGEYD